PHFNLAFIEELVGVLRGFEDKPTIYLTGAHGTVAPDWVFNKFSVDFVIAGEPEETIYRICAGENPKDVEGVIYMSGGRLVRNPPAEPVDLDSLPNPAFHLLPMDKYYYEIMGDHFTLLEGSRGCPFNCVFCLKKMYSGYRKKSPQKLIEEIDYVVAKQDVRNIYFIDLEFTVNRQQVECVCRHLIEKKYSLRWCCQTRADSLDEELLKLMRDAGCVLIHFGVETGDPDIMRDIGKNITLEDIEEGFRLTHKMGIDSAGFFMFGFPGETKENMEKTIDFAKKLNPVYASFHSAAPYPGTRMNEYYRGRQVFPLCVENEFSLGELRAVVRRAFLSFYLRPGYVISRILRGNPRSWWQQIKLFTRYITKSKI
ncbi:MAG: radical SAM protein, partial [Candidatus Altiarchaeales archaeon]|nr:radical SAM protein [Candidatus Altiarchaeales archaeon]